MSEDRPGIVVCDDNTRRVKHWAEDIAGVPEVEEKYRPTFLLPKDFADAYVALKTRQRTARRKSPGAEDDAARILDHTAIVVIDYDLTPASGYGGLDEKTLNTLSGAFGDNFAYLTRCYTRAGFTVLVNQDFFKSTFDLTHKKFSFSNADLNVAHNDLSRSELWAGRSDGRAYRPWHWPRLLDAADRLQRLTDGLDLDARVLASLGLDDDDTYAQFTPEQLELFGSRPRGVTFRRAAGFTSDLNGLKEESISESNLPKVAVASVSNWLERIVLPAQNVLIDAPHLAQRRPGLLTTVDPREWGALSDLSDPAASAALFDSDVVAKAEASQVAPWLSRPAWLWHRCPRTPVRAAGEPHVFCEDVSAFHPLVDAWEYRSAVAGPYDQRFILHEGVATRGLAIDYWPVQRLFADAQSH